MKEQLYLDCWCTVLSSGDSVPTVSGGTRKGILPNLLLCTRKLLLLTTLYDESYDLSSVCVCTCVHGVERIYGSTGYLSVTSYATMCFFQRESLKQLNLRCQNLVPMMVPQCGTDFVTRRSRSHSLKVAACLCTASSIFIVHHNHIIGYSKENLKIHTGVPSPPCPPSTP